LFNQTPPDRSQVLSAAGTKRRVAFPAFDGVSGFKSPRQTAHPNAGM